MEKGREIERAEKETERERLRHRRGRRGCEERDEETQGEWKCRQAQIKPQGDTNIARKKMQKQNKQKTQKQ